MQQQQNAKSNTLQTPAQAPPREAVFEYKLKSIAPVKQYNVMKVSGKKIDFNAFNSPVRLWREKELRSHKYYLKQVRLAQEAAAAAVAEATTSTPVLPDAVKKVDQSEIAPYGASAPRKQVHRKKTRVYQGAAAVAIQNREKGDRVERDFGWTLQDDEALNSYLGRPEAGHRAGYVLFVMQDQEFKVIPSSKWYNFSQRPNYQTLSLEEAENALKNRNKEIDRWLMKTLRVNENNVFEKGDRIKPVTSKVKKLPENAEDGFDYDEQFEDDEEIEDDIVKEEGEWDSSRKGAAYGTSQSTGNFSLTQAGKEMRKLVQDLDPANVADGDDDGDPYASSEDELMVDEVTKNENINNMPTLRIKQEAVTSRPPSRSTTPVSRLPIESSKRKPVPPKGKINPTSSLSRSITPGNLSPEPGANAEAGLVMVKQESVCSSNMPLKRSASELVGSPELKKAKKEESTSSTPTPDSVASNDVFIRQDEVIKYLSRKPMKTKELIHKFKAKLRKDTNNMAIFKDIVKKIATVKAMPDESGNLENYLTLKESYL